MTQRLGWWVMVVAALAMGCDEETAGSDAGGGGGDAGEGMDGGGGDAGVEPVDCTMPVTDAWWTPPDDLPAFDETQRGVVVACGVDASIDAETVDERARMPYRIEPGDPGFYDGPTLTEGADVTRVLYRSERTNGDGGFGSGTLYLPSSGASAQPLVVHVSGTTGLADICAPSRGRFKDLERTLYVLIGNGHAVFVPDLMGLGTPGSMAYLEATDAAHSVLDGARAALAAAPEGALNGELLLSGHSAGGHAVLSAQALQREYAPELNVIGVASLAGLWFDTEVFSELLSAPGYSTAGDDGWNVVYGAMYFIGHAAAYDGEDAAYDVIHPERRAAIRDAYESTCVFAEEGMMDTREALAAVAGSAGQVFDPGFQNDFVSRFWCDTDMLDRCPDRVLEWLDRFEADRPTLDPEGAPIWFHIGSDDARITPESMQCPILVAEHSGVDTETCFYDGLEHSPTSGVAAPWLAAWVEALGSGEAAPACPDATPFPFGDPTRCGIDMPEDAGMTAGADAGVDAGP